ncbi:MAG: MBL fold metallo-hydrolase [Lachnospiraceae bacterium]|nr:MBL fold metallo-hydrolase [Lachnospiraceae bacterium]
MNTENIRVITQNCIRIGSGAGVIYIDPFKLNEEPHDADYILLTHDHYDHFSPEDIRKVSKAGTVMIVPEKMESQAGELTDAVDMICTAAPDVHKKVGELEFYTVAAYNRLKPFHPKKAGWIGYILNVDGVKIYIAGDTDMTPENEKVVCDIAMIPIGGTYTMNAGQAAELVNKIRPTVAIPTHYGSVVGSPADADDFAKKVDTSVRVEIKMEY